MSVTLIEAALLLFIVGSALATALLSDVLAAIIVFGAYSFGMSILWVVLQAPDVGLTEAAVGAGVMTVLLLITIAKTTRVTDVDGTIVSVDRRAALVSLAFAVAVLATLPELPTIGDPTAPALQHVAPHYLEHAYHDTHVENVVTAVLVAYRGFDTFGEATVVFAAGIAVLVVLGREVP